MKCRNGLLFEFKRRARGAVFSTISDQLKIPSCDLAFYLANLGALLRLRQRRRESWARFGSILMFLIYTTVSAPNQYYTSCRGRGGWAERLHEAPRENSSLLATTSHSSPLTGFGGAATFRSCLPFPGRYLEDPGRVLLEWCAAPSGSLFPDSCANQHRPAAPRRRRSDIALHSAAQ